MFPEKRLGPAYLSDLIPTRRERHDTMVIYLTNSISVILKRGAAFPVAFKDSPDRFGVPSQKPGEQRGTEVEIEIRVIVMDGGDHSL
jgi:hypothetical protein